MTTFKPWEYRAEAGFVKGTELTGYKVVATAISVTSSRQSMTAPSRRTST